MGDVPAALTLRLQYLTRCVWLSFLCMLSGVAWGAAVMLRFSSLVALEAENVISMCYASVP